MLVTTRNNGWSWTDVHDEIDFCNSVIGAQSDPDELLKRTGLCGEKVPLRAQASISLTSSAGRRATTWKIGSCKICLSSGRRGCLIWPPPQP